MRIFLFISSALALLISAHKFSLADPSGQYKGALFFLLMGIQLLIAAALISEHRESQKPKPSASGGQEGTKEFGASVADRSEDFTKKS